MGILLAGLLLALTYIGGEIAQSALGLPAAALRRTAGAARWELGRRRSLRHRVGVVQTAGRRACHAAEVTTATAPTADPRRERTRAHQRAWGWYDWANSAYVTTTATVMTARRP